LQYFSPDNDTELYVDASPVGLAAILMQKSPNNTYSHVVEYASCALSPVKQRYSQTEREALAVVWACEHLHIYLYGAKFVVYTDHKPLLSLLGSTRTIKPARKERWSLRLQPYEFEIIYRPGIQNPADYLSRHTSSNERRSREEKIAEEYINYVMNCSMPKAITLQDIKNAYDTNELIKLVIRAHKDGKWYQHRPQRNSHYFDS
jgi:hypothetical protein